MSEPKEIFVQPERCVACLSCTMACAVEHTDQKNLYAALGASPAPRSRIYVESLPAAERPSVPIVCRHCEDAPCMHACINGAISKDAAGVVLTDAARCIGCWTCVMVCPFGVIGRQQEIGKAYRCDRCPDLDTPACVTACPTNALVYRSVADYAGGVRKGAAAELIAGEGG